MPKLSKRVQLNELGDGPDGLPGVTVIAGSQDIRFRASMSECRGWVPLFNEAVSLTLTPGPVSGLVDALKAIINARDAIVAGDAPSAVGVEGPAEGQSFANWAAERALTGLKTTIEAGD